MPGNGPHWVAPGQVTDDSELAMCLMWAIINGNRSLLAENSKNNVNQNFENKKLDPKFSLVELGKMYSKWI